MAISPGLSPAQQVREDTWTNCPPPLLSTNTNTHINNTITNTNMTFVKGRALQNPPGVWINLLNVSRPLSVSHCHCHSCLLLSTKLYCHYYNFYNRHSSEKYNRHKLNPTHQSRAPLCWSCYELVFGEESGLPGNGGYLFIWSGYSLYDFLESLNYLFLFIFKKVY